MSEHQPSRLTVCVCVARGVLPNFVVPLSFLLALSTGGVMIFAAFLAAGVPSTPGVRRGDICECGENEE